MTERFLRSQGGTQGIIEHPSFSEARALYGVSIAVGEINEPETTAGLIGAIIGLVVFFVVLPLAGMLIAALYFKCQHNTLTQRINDGLPTPTPPVREAPPVVTQEEIPTTPEEDNCSETCADSDQEENNSLGKEENDNLP